MNPEEQQVSAAPKSGLEAVNEKLDIILSAAKKADEKATNAAEKAALLEAELAAAKNTHNISFVPAGSAPEIDGKKELNAKIKTFLNNVKQARYGYDKKDALQAGATPGSYLVPEGFLPTVIDMLGTVPSLINETRYIPWGLDGNTRKIPNLVSRSTFSVVDEGEAKPVSNPVFNQLTQVLVKAAAIVLYTKELAEDSAVDVSNLLQSLIAPALAEYYTDWIFNGNGDANPGILTASGVLNPTVATVSGLVALKLAVPSHIAATGKFYIDKALYGELIGLTRSTAPLWLTYENGVMRIDGSEVVKLDSSLIGARNAVFGDLQNIIFSPRTELAVRYSDTATIVEGASGSATTHHLFQENKEAYLFETRAAITVVGSVWAKTTVPAVSA